MLLSIAKDVVAILQKFMPRRLNPVNSFLRATLAGEPTRFLKVALLSAQGLVLNL
jgi:hypothetical protein